ncbi:hypothetical protein [Thalassomonas sp. RHCl1]|uniref:hypothetical protein n=1 Tax=Thalassomonas sp. RHCl1 TaxID=2995320 RepID=UPI00248CBD75|nr:hypothetical protein [Thalassomonas sp. RHCl1]
MNTQWIAELIAQWLASVGIEAQGMQGQERLHMAFENSDRLCIEPIEEQCRVSVIHKLAVHDRLKVVENILGRTSFRQRGPFRICAAMQGENLLILSVFFTREQGGLSQLQQALDHLRKHL